MMIFLSPGISRFMIGWAKPVPVNPYNLRNPRVDDILVSMAGPAMNLVLAVALMALARVGLLAHVGQLTGLCVQMAALSLLLCFFNLIPIPPLDGSHVLRNLTGMSWEAYAKFAQFGFIAVIVVIQIPLVRDALNNVTFGTLAGLAVCFGFPTR
jgi:Zn-dependent protease